MLLNARTFPQRLPRAFQDMTRLEFQIKSASTVTIAREQGEAQAITQGDGVQLTQANTSPPWGEWWKGELWYVSNVDNSPFVVLIIGTADDGGVLTAILRKLVSILERMSGG